MSFMNIKQCRKRLAIGLGCLLVMIILSCGVNRGVCDEIDFTGNYFEMFGLDQNTFEKEELKAKYKKYAKRYHPDLNKSDDAQEKFTNLSQAYTTLLDDEKRQEYEASLNPDDNDMESIEEALASMFGFGGMGRKARKQPAAAMYVGLPIPLNCIVNGGSVDISVEAVLACKECKGFGGDKKNIEICQRCNGKGKIEQMKSMMGGSMFQLVSSICDKCNGEKKVIKKKCSKCLGKMVSSQTIKHCVHIEKGTKANEKIVKKGKGNWKPECTRGDLVFTTYYDLGEGCKVSGSDIYWTQTITLAESLDGFKKTVPFVDNKPVNLVRKGETESGTIDVIYGRGVPEDDCSRGDLYIIYNVSYKKKEHVVEKYTDL